MLEAVWRDPIQIPSPDPLQCPAKMEHVRFGVRTRYFPLGLTRLFLGLTGGGDERTVRTVPSPSALAIRCNAVPGQWSAGLPDAVRVSNLYACLKVRVSNWVQHPPAYRVEGVQGLLDLLRRGAQAGLRAVVIATRNLGSVVSNKATLPRVGLACLSFV